VGILVVAHFVLGYFGYELNLNYFSSSKSACQENIQVCTSNLVRQGVDNVKCDINCIDPKLIIKKK
jgi:hypothetical protein